MKNKPPSKSEPFDYDKEELIAEEIVKNSPQIKALIKRVVNKLKGQAA